MGELLYKQFELTRRQLLKEIGTIPEEMIGIQPEGFNNTIQWHIGHIVTVTEQFMFGFPKKSTNLPENYLELFGNGTKPGDWSGVIPSLEELTDHLKCQVVRIKEIPIERLQETMKKPFMGFETFGELANMAVYHEAYHHGQIHVMRKLIEKSN